MFNVLDFAKGQKGEAVVTTLDLKSVCVACSIMNETFVKLQGPPKE